MAPANFDQVLERIGGFGKYQKFLLLLLGIAALPMAAMTLGNVFISGLPHHSCYIPELANLSTHQQQLISSPPERSSNGEVQDGKYDACHVYDVDYSSLDLTLNATDHAHIRSNSTELRSCSAWVYDDSVFSYTIVNRWNLVCSEQWKKSLAQSLFMLGFLIGAVGFGAVADRFGRRPAFFSSALCFIVSGVAAALMPTYWSHVFVRLLTAAAGAGMFTTGFVIQMEMIGVADRMIPGILYQAWFAAGYMLLAPLAYFVRNYVHLQLVLSLCPALLFFYVWLLGESPRWLMSQGKLEECGKEVRRAAKMNGTEYPEDLLQPTQSSKSVPEEKTEKAYSLIDLLRTPNMRLKTLNILYNWFVNSFVYYGLTLAMAELPGGPYLNLFIGGCVEFVGFVPAILMLDRIGRRLPLAGLLMTAGLSCIVIAGIPEEYAIVTTVLAMLGKLGISGSFAIIYVFSAELFPTVARSSGVGVGSMSARTGGLLAPFLADLIHVWRPLPFLIFGSVSLVAGVLTMLLPETLHRNLPETLEDGEKFSRGKFEWYCKTSGPIAADAQNGDLLENEKHKKTQEMPNGEDVTLVEKLGATANGTTN